MDTEGAWRAFFAPGGALARALAGHEDRPQQITLATAVAKILAEGGQLAAEAGTGTGKTLAYLVPALSSGKRVVVSTASKNLQDQIIDKDVPLLEKALGRPVDVQVLKGRANYLCEARADATLAQRALFDSGASRFYDMVVAWRQRTQTGDRAELTDLGESSPLWREISATSEQCTGRHCPEYERCWVTRMRRQAQVASLSLVNHHLYLADAALRQRADDGVYLLPPHDAVIFDEAHGLDEVATQHFGYEVSLGRVDDFLKDVAAAVVGQGAIASRLRPLLRPLRETFRTLLHMFPCGERVGRFGWDIEDVDGGGRGATQMLDGLQAQYQETVRLLRLLESELVGASFDGSKLLGGRAATLAAELAFVLGVPADASLAQEIELPGDDVPYVRFAAGDGAHRAMVARPVDAAPLLGRLVGRMPAVFVSATLRVQKSFAHFRRRIGVHTLAEVAVDSPFDYQRQAALYMAVDLPVPGQTGAEEALQARAVSLLLASQGGAFVLCTSHRMLPLMAGHIRRATGLRVLTQGHTSRAHLLATFAAHGNAVLVATMSFWKGVDVPGSALRLVLIDRLPFASPGDPLVEARIEHARRLGEDPFMNFQLPHAALLLQQGFGRLIRRRSDRGMVAVLDARIARRSYGKLLLRSLPPCRQITDGDEACAYLRSLQAARSP